LIVIYRFWLFSSLDHSEQNRLLSSPLSPELKILLILQAVIAFIIVFALNYFALGLTPVHSFLGAVGFTVLLGFWAGYRYKRYIKKQRERAEAESSEAENGEKE
jgi:hypothetical protein